MEQTSSGTGVLPKNVGGLMGLRPSSRDYWALNNLVFMTVLLIQFGTGMEIDLFVNITRHHPGVGATSLVSGVFVSVAWAILHGPIVLAIHAALGLGIAVHSIHNFAWNLRWGTRGSAWAAGIGALLVWAAGFNGGVFLNFDNDVNSLLMALFLGAAILCYAIVVYLLARSPAAGTAPRPTAPMR